MDFDEKLIKLGNLSLAKPKNLPELLEQQSQISRAIEKYERIMQYLAANGGEGASADLEKTITEHIRLINYQKELNKIKDEMTIHAAKPEEDPSANIPLNKL